MTEEFGIAADHGGLALKAHLLEAFSANGLDLRDYGALPADGSVDYPDYALRLADAVLTGKVARGILICGTGIGMSIAANKIPGIRAALVWDEFTARMAREHNDAQILCLGARVLNHDRALEFVNIWLNASFAGGRHTLRLAKIHALESHPAAEE